MHGTSSDSKAPTGSGSSLGLAAKIWLGVSILILGYVFTVGLDLAGAASQGKQITATADHIFPATQASAAAVVAFDKQTTRYLDAVMMGEEEGVDEAGTYAGEVQSALLTTVDLCADDPELAQQARQLAEDCQRYTGDADQVYRALCGFDASDADQARARDLAARQQQLRVGLATLADAAADELRGRLAQMQAAAESRQRTNMIVCIVVLLVAGAVISLIIQRLVMGPVRAAIAALMAHSGQVQGSADQLASSSQQIADSTSEQAAGLQETSASLEQLASRTTQNASNARQANQVSTEVFRASQSSQEAMVRMSDAIQRIKDSADSTAKIIQTIDEIAFQTNLLALNAAVEAARAGEAGKGFAVVAEEVRNLAQRSAEAARNTAGLLEESRRNSDHGVAVVVEVGKTLEEIVSGIGDVSQLIDSVATASDEQAEGVAEINRAVTQMDQLTQNNAAIAEESASASQVLNDQAQRLSTVATDLERVMEGRSHHRPAPDAQTRRNSARAAKTPPLPRPAVSRTSPRTTSNTAPCAVLPLEEDELVDL